MRIYAPSFALTHAKNHEEQRHFKRAVARGEYVEPMRGFFARTLDWNALKWDERKLEEIYALARVHPNWTFTGLTAAAICGIMLPHEWLYEELHVAVERGTRIRHASLNIRVHEITGSSRGLPPPDEELSEDERELQELQPSIIFSPDDLARSYEPLTDTVALVNGVRVLVPEHIICECLRAADFVHALAVADMLAQQFPGASAKLAQVIRERSGDHGMAKVALRARFIDEKSGSIEESMLRARLIQAGFPAPRVQVDYMPSFRHAPDGERLRASVGRTLRAAYTWERPRPGLREVKELGRRTRARATGHVAAPDRVDRVVVLLDDLHPGAGLAPPGMLRSEFEALRRLENERLLARVLALKSIGCDVIHVSAEDNFRTVCEKIDAAGVKRVSFQEQRKRGRYL
ncbi:hypothetical protein [Alloscardovia macacae]|uniref:Uncharacterized protein n=1 Tax=Alloscardovia macacae TaxID=1160091 RepID=A0A261F743_9BIFI|nr:hypothetical protein [Alloscardovia macacae]OZG54885.1 hypothetical protein ALMA_0210 [Alloscardovia macacae]